MPEAGIATFGTYERNMRKVRDFEEDCRAMKRGSVHQEAMTAALNQVKLLLESSEKKRKSRKSESETEQQQVKAPEVHQRCRKPNFRVH